MSDYTHLNLRDDVEDSAVSFGLAPDLEAHFASKPLGLEQSGISFQRLAPNHRGSFGHRHKTQEEVYVVVGGSGRIKVGDDVLDLRPLEVYVVVGGSGRIKVGDDVLDLRPLDAVRVPAATTRAFEAGPDGLELLAYGAPATGPGDAEVEQGWWSD
jgi:mannose-6-phosphate isomerase-like protein (cupin superfamily)